MRMAVIDRGGGDAREEHELAASHDDARRVGHHHVGTPIGVVNDRDLFRHRHPPRNAQASYHAVPRRPGARSTLGGMPVLLVLEDDSATRNGLVDALRSLYAGVRVAAARSDAAPGIVTVERADVVLASMPAVERLYRNGAPEGVTVVALTREMSPATLMRAEPLGVAGSVRVPAGAEQRTAVLGPIMDALPH